ncbi:MAG TPA: DNA polymerase III subunit gamma/tau [Lacipirellulaceae bacterium]|jgi:DNA polymerase-3 subunit gamma/tau|nr:DNA polymerase III subunit gamma/tau [Lacipirellulaceae bacterium]
MSDSRISTVSADQSASRRYVVIARRYRPQTFDELVGQEHVARALQQAITSDRVGHAYLFTGARGVGKTSAARIFAKALNCVRGPTPTPCNECDVCVSVSTGDDVDVLEIDGASNRGIDEIRQLRQNVAVRPSRVRYKIYIIDEVHMLTKEAFNALLKTLEEPPEHVKFIFATTEPHKIPITILSRCQRFDFAGISHNAIEQRLAQIAAAEGVTVDAESLAILASRASGSMRDSQSLLEQLLAVGHERITAADVTELLGIAPAERLSGLVVQLVARNAAGALAELDAIVCGGVEVGLLLDQLVGYFRDVMATAVGCSADQMLYALPSQAEEVRKVSEKLGLSTVLAIAQILDQAAARMRFTMHGRTLVEMAVVRICQLDELDDIAAVVAELRGTPTAAGASGSMPSAKASSRATSEVTRPAASRSNTPPAGAAKKNDEPALVQSASAANSADDSKPSKSGEPLNDLTAAALWQRAVVDLGDTVAGSAVHADRIVAGGDDLIVASFPAAYSFCRDICERPEMRSRLERALSQAHGGNIRLKLKVHDDAPANREPARPQRTSRREQLAEVAEQPFVRRAMELFDVPAGQFRYTPPDADAN